MSNTIYPNFTLEDMISFGNQVSELLITEEDVKSWLLENSEFITLKDGETNG